MPKKEIAHSFVLDALLDSKLAPEVRVNPMFGCHAIYVGEKIVLITRHRDSSPADNGLWVVVQPEARAGFRKEYPTLRPIELFETKKQDGPTWLCLSETSRTFEDDALRIVELVIARDLRLGKVPKAKVAKTKKRTKKIIKERR